jgi:hypothetical protein
MPKSRYKCIYRKIISYFKCSMDWRKEQIPRWNHQDSDSDKNSFLGPFMQRLLYFDFKETQITARNSFVPEVRNVCPKGGTNYFNIR